MRSRYVVLMMILLPISVTNAARIEESIILHSPQDATVNLKLIGFTNQSLALNWPLSRSQIISLEGNGILIPDAEKVRMVFSGLGEETVVNHSFRIRLTQGQGSRVLLPVAKPNLTTSRNSLEAVLPPNWTAICLDNQCEKSYQQESDRIVLIWEDVQVDQCTVKLVKPGPDNSELVSRMSWMLLRGYLFLIMAAALIIAGSIMGWRLVTE